MEGVDPSVKIYVWGKESFEVDSQVQMWAGSGSDTSLVFFFFFEIFPLHCFSQLVQIHLKGSQSLTVLQSEVFKPYIWAGKEGKLSHTPLPASVSS